MSLIDPFAMPGMGTPAETTEREFLCGVIGSWQHIGVVLVSTAVDAGMTPTTLLRRGLLLGKVTASGKYKQYDPTATDGSQVAAGILLDDTNMLDGTGTAADKAARMVWFGYVKAAQVYNLNALARRQLANRIFFDDGLVNPDAVVQQVIAKTADYTVVAATDNNAIFTNQGASGAVIFTLPAIARGLKFTFYSEAAQNITITAGTADTIVTHNDLAADSIALSTSNRQIGGSVTVVANADGTKWLAFPGTWNVADDGSTTTKFTIAS